MSRNKFSDEILAAEGIAYAQKDMPLGWAAQYLRAYLNRTDLAMVVVSQGQNNFDIQIEKSRNLIASGKYNEAQSVLQSLAPSTPNENGEYAIEMSRILHYANNNDECINLCNKTLLMPELNPVSRMTITQIRGVSYIQTQDYNSALIDLHEVAAHATLFPYSKAIVCAIAYLVWLYCHLNNRDEAQKYLLQLQHHLDLIQENKSVWISRLLFYIRAQFHFETKFGVSVKSNTALMDSLFLAQWLDDNETVKKAKMDIAKRDLQVVFYEKWYWIESQKIVLWKGTTAFTNLQASPLLCKLIEVLKTGPKSFDSLFEQTWGLKYESRHEKTLRSTLSKLRKVLPGNSLLVKESIVYFN